ncbi:MAG: tRNA (adenosine(37)-N6)-dimethylallyltransferase MiaA [Chloroflexi bacterium]|nr:tRNA (adenosine(37)-N6)-dimethylallyltransferase MiaA [Chloroflexota bacterium]
MVEPHTQPTVVFIVGATASGKTEASLELARRFPVEIVNADSRLVYKGMDIGTAKPSIAEQSQVTHHLLDLVAPDEPYSLALYLQQAHSAINTIIDNGKLPVVVGGTGQYAWALIEGWNVPEVPPQPELRGQLEREIREQGVEALVTRLAELDPATAQRIDQQNPRRVIRALEVVLTTGKSFSDQRRRTPPPFDPYVAGLWVPRDELHRRIDARVDAMVEAGWLEEVRGLLSQGYSPELPSFSGVGYSEVTADVRGEMAWEDALEKTRVSVHRLARGQNAWFKHNDPRIHWAGSQGELIGGLREAALW